MLQTCCGEGLSPTTGGALERISMLKWALIFAVVSLICGALGFSGVAAGAAGLAKLLFGLFLLVVVVLLVLAVLGVGAVL
jgi:uncharacterized membrane protein YtjA (UPF0391 family)